MDVKFLLDKVIKENHRQYGTKNMYGNKKNNKHNHEAKTLEEYAPRLKHERC